MSGKIIIVSAPSGCGKSTIINTLIDRGMIDVRFSVSATNRAPRKGEVDGVNYHFLSDEEFRSAIDRGEFVEYEEVYPGRYYGTLRSEVEQRVSRGENVLLDIDVCGGVNVKKQFGDRAISLFIMPPSIAALGDRLRGRATESEEEIARRLGRAEYELGFASQYDVQVVNDDLETAIAATGKVINDFVSSH